MLNNRVRFCSKFIKVCQLDSLYDLMVIFLGFGLSIIFGIIVKIPKWSAMSVIMIPDLY